MVQQPRAAVSNCALNLPTTEVNPRIKSFRALFYVMPAVWRVETKPPPGNDLLFDDHGKLF
jgi:hypothetical protein